MVLEQEWSLNILQKVDFFMSQDCEVEKVRGAGRGLLQMDVCDELQCS